MTIKQIILGIMLVGGLFLSGCGKPKHEDFQKTEIELKINVYDTEEQLQREVGDKIGQARWSPDDNKCEIWIVKWDMETAGHELHHCMFGSFHKEQH